MNKILIRSLYFMILLASILNLATYNTYADSEAQTLNLEDVKSKYNIPSDIGVTCDYVLLDSSRGEVSKTFNLNAGDKFSIIELTKNFDAMWNDILPENSNIYVEGVKDAKPKGGANPELNCYVHTYKTIGNMSGTAKLSYELTVDNNVVSKLTVDVKVSNPQTPATPKPTPNLTPDPTPKITEMPVQPTTQKTPHQMPGKPNIEQPANDDDKNGGPKGNPNGGNDNRGSTGNTPNGGNNPSTNNGGGGTTNNGGTNTPNAGSHSSNPSSQNNQDNTSSGNNSAKTMITLALTAIISAITLLLTSLLKLLMF